MTLPCCTLDGEYFQPFKLEGEDAARWISSAVTAWIFALSALISPQSPIDSAIASWIMRKKLFCSRR